MQNEVVSQLTPREKKILGQAFQAHWRRAIPLWKVVTLLLGLALFWFLLWFAHPFIEPLFEPELFLLIILAISVGHSTIESGRQRELLRRLHDMAVAALRENKRLVGRPGAT